MSRIGRLPIKIPTNVDVIFNEVEITVKGKFGTLQKTTPDIIRIEQDTSNLIIRLL